MTTASASRSVLDVGAVLRSHELLAMGVTRSQLRAHIAARRWRRIGSAIVLHNHDPTREQWWEIARINAGPRAALTAFTAAELAGLKGYERDVVHVLVPAGTRKRICGGPGIRLHFSATWCDEQLLRPHLHRLAPSLIRAASTFSSARPACGLLAAAVQQRLLRPADLEAALKVAGRPKHASMLRLAVADIAQGAQALGEIDFVRLCRRHGLPEPQLQRVRPDPAGRRRYLDASWVRRDGRLVVVEVDGAIHLQLRVWFEDQLRQNELMLADALMLRYPSVVVRTEQTLVVSQLRRALWR